MFSANFIALRFHHLVTCKCKLGINCWWGWTVRGYISISARYSGKVVTIYDDNNQLTINIKLWIFKPITCNIDSYRRLKKTQSYKFKTTLDRNRFSTSSEFSSSKIPSIRYRLLYTVLPFCYKLKSVLRK